MKTGNFVKFISKISLRNVARPLMYCEGNCFIIHLKLCFGIFKIVSAFCFGTANVEKLYFGNGQDGAIW